MIAQITRAGNPFPAHGTSRDRNGVIHFDDLPGSLPAMLHGWVERSPDAEAVVELDGDRLSYRQLWDRAGRVAGGLRARGVTGGSRVALRYPAGVRWVLGFWGTLLVGGVAVAVNIRSAQPEVEFVLEDSGVVVDLGPGDPLPDGEPYVAPVPARDAVAAMFYTSGTTGRPKGVPTTHEAFLTNCENLVRVLGVTSDVGSSFRTLISVPLLIMPEMKPARVAAALPAERISFMVTVPAVYALLLGRSALDGIDVSGVRWVCYGGAPIAASLVRELKAAFGAAELVNGFGMTETSSLVAALPHRDVEEYADSVGYAVPGIDLAVDLSEGSDTGELLARGAGVLHEYWNRPDATAAAFVDGWLRTGDIVRVDDAGRIYVVDRAKDIIIRGGENVSSVEVESALESVPGVTEAAVIGVPDDVMGEKVGAVVVVEGEPDVTAIIEHCGRQIAGFKVPQYLTVWEGPLPRNPGGKLLKAQLREQVTWGEPLR